MTANRRRLLTATLLVALCTLLGACVGPQYSVGVSGFTDPAYAGGKSYWLLPGQKGVTDDDLEFREYARYVRRGLSQAAFFESAGLDHADLVIFLSYGIGDTKEHHYSYSLPIYGQTGGGTASFRGTIYSGYGSATTYGTIYQQPQFGVVGSQQISGTDVTHLRYMFVDALDGKAYRTDNKMVSVWRTDVMSRGSSGDLRRVFPVLVVAATPHFGKNTKERIILDISETDKKLEEMRAGGEK